MTVQTIWFGNPNLKPKLPSHWPPRLEKKAHRNSKNNRDAYASLIARTRKDAHVCLRACTRKYACACLIARTRVFACASILKKFKTFKSLYFASVFNGTLKGIYGIPLGILMLLRFPPTYQFRGSRLVQG